LAATLSVEKRENIGSNSCKGLRKSGKMPGVIYGEKQDAVSITLSTEKFSELLLHKGVIEIGIGKQKENVMIKEVQYDTFGEQILHVDFQRVSLDKKIKVSVALKFIGEPEGVKAGGHLDTQLRELELFCFHNEIPDFIPVNIEHVEIGQQVKVKDLKIDEKYTLETASHKTILIVHIPRGMKGQQEEEEGEEEVSTEEKTTS